MGAQDPRLGRACVLGVTTVIVFRLLLIVLLAAGVIAWMTRDYDVSLAGMLPFWGDGPVGLYDLAGAIMIVWAAWAARRLWQRR